MHIHLLRRCTRTALLETDPGAVRAGYDLVLNGNEVGVAASGSSAPCPGKGL